MTDIEKIEILKAVLREAILDPRRIADLVAEEKPNSYRVVWRERVKKWAALCDLDLPTHNPWTRQVGE